VRPEVLSEFERRTREHFMTAVVSAVDATWQETKRLELGDVAVYTIIGIMHRALDDVRVRFGWL
jgi:hypothetical protein